MCIEINWVVVSAVGSICAGFGAIISGYYTRRNFKTETDRTQRIFDIEEKRDQEKQIAAEKQRIDEIIKLYGHLREQPRGWKSGFKILTSLYPEFRNEQNIRKIVTRLLAYDFHNQTEDVLIDMLKKSELLG